MILKSILPTLLILFILIGFLGLLFLFNSNSVVTDPTIAIQPQHPQIFRIDGKSDVLINVMATTLPRFVVNMAEDKFKNLWQVEASERSSKVASSAINEKGDQDLQVNMQLDDTKKEAIFTPQTENSVKPGLYKLNIKVKTTTGEDIIITQDFTWGVLAINTNKGIYHPGEVVKIGMAVLDDLGNTKCKGIGEPSFSKARVWLTITSPSGKVEKLSSDDDTIAGSRDCADRSVTNEADFLTHIEATEVGRYKINMVAENILGKRSIDDFFDVKKDEPFAIERSSFPTRIYPRSPYPVQVTVSANKNYSGPAYDVVPGNFKITNISDGGDIIRKNGSQVIKWKIDLKRGDVKNFTYVIKFPPITPEFYLVGPFKIGSYSEGREWQVASDTIFQFIQQNHNVANSTTVNTTMSAYTVGHLLLAICYRVTNNSFSSPTGGGWTTAYNNSSGERIYMYYKVISGTTSTTVQCNTTTSGVIGVQAIEFSGNSATSVRDQRSRTNSAACTAGAHPNATTALTPGNPDVLAVAAFSASATTTVGSHTSYLDVADPSTSFNGASGTFDSSWSELANNPPVSTTDTANYNASGTACSNLLVTFNPTISVSQGSYRFFANTDSTTPGTTLAAVNTPISLNQPNAQFRVRMLLDTDSPSLSTIGLGIGDWALQYAALPSSNDCGDGIYDFVSTSSAIAYNPNPTPHNLDSIISSGNDPSDTGSGYTTVLENYIELYTDDNTDNDISNNQTIMANNQAGLFDFSLVDNTDDSISTTYCLKITDPVGNDLAAYRNYPQITTILLDVVLRGGSTIRGGTVIQ